VAGRQLRNVFDLVGEVVVGHGLFIEITGAVLQRMTGGSGEAAVGEPSEWDHDWVGPRLNHVGQLDQQLVAFGRDAVGGCTRLPLYCNFHTRPMKVARTHGHEPGTKTGTMPTSLIVPTRTEGGPHGLLFRFTAPLSLEVDRAALRTHGTE
jgi:hypothetical protein